MPVVLAALMPAAGAIPLAQSHEGGAYARGPEGAGAAHSGSSGEVYHGPGGTTVAHGSADAHGAAVGPGGAAAGGKEVSGTAVKGPEGNEYTHETSAGRGAAAGPEGAEAGRYASSSSTYHAPGGASYPTASRATVRRSTALANRRRLWHAGGENRHGCYAGYHQTEAVSGSVYAARGAAVRTSYSGLGMYGQEWHAANPGAWTPTGWTAGQAWAPATWPAVGASLGWGSVQPVGYNYGTTSPTRTTRSITAANRWPRPTEYYQQAATLAESAPRTDATSDEWLPLGVFALVQKEQSDPHYVMQLAVNKAGAIGGNYSDLVGGTTVSHPGSCGQEDPARRLDGGKEQEYRLRNRALQLDPGRSAGTHPHRQGQDPAVAAGPAETTGTGELNRSLKCTAIIEAATGLALMAVPSVVVRLLLGSEISGASVPLGRVAGLGLLSLGIACWPLRDPTGKTALPSGRC